LDQSLIFAALTTYQFSFWPPAREGCPGGHCLSSGQMNAIVKGSHFWIIFGPFLTNGLPLTNRFAATFCKTFVQYYFEDQSQ